MLHRFRSVALSVIRRRGVIKALTPPALQPPTDAGAPSPHQASVSMEYLSKLQTEYTTLLTRINAVTDKLSPHSRRQHSLWSSLAVEEYFHLIFRAHETYAKLVPYWEPSKLPSFGWHWTHRVVRSKVLNRIIEFSNLLGFAKSLRGQKAAVFLSLLQEELDDYFETSDRSAILDLLRDLSDASGEFPSTFWLVDVKRSSQRAYGGDAEVWVGSYAGQEVAVRDFWYPSEMSPERLQKVIRKEILANRQLNHPNVLKLIGVFNEESRPMSVVTPWMANGLALTYLDSHPVELLHILRGVIDGMQYLHSLDPPIIHGAIQPRNILVNAEGDAVIRDLGITRIRMEVATSLDERIAGFSPRYQAPELMTPVPRPSATTDCHPLLTAAAPSFVTDVYSLAMSFYHIITRTQPFHSTSHPTLTSPTSILRAVSAGERPPTPPLPQHRATGAGGNLFDEDLVALWAILGEMWHKDPQVRPHISAVAAKIMKLENRPACRSCADQHRSRECIKITDDGPCADCSSGGIECVEVIEDAQAGRGYGINIIGREATVDGYYVTTLELPPSPEGALVPGATLETRRVRLVPFQWQRRRRTSSARASS